MGKGNKQTTTTRLDPESQRYVDQMRRHAATAARGLTGPLTTGPIQESIGQQAARFFNPYQDQVIAGVRDQFNRLRTDARFDTNDAATRAGAFGGSRHGVAEGVRMTGLDAAEAAQVGGLLHQGYNDAVSRGTAYAEHQRQLAEQQLREPLMRAQAQQGLFAGGMGPTGQTSTTETPGNLWKDVAGVALTGASFLAGGPAGPAMIGMQGLRGAGTPALQFSTPAPTMPNIGRIQLGSSIWG